MYKRSICGIRLRDISVKTVPLYVKKLRDGCAWFLAHSVVAWSMNSWRCLLTRWQPLLAYGYQVRREGGSKGDMSPSENATLKNLSPNSMQFVTFNQISAYFRVSGVCPRPHPGLCPCLDPRWWRNPLFCPLQNKFLATPLMGTAIKHPECSRPSECPDVKNYKWWLNPARH